MIRRLLCAALVFYVCIWYTGLRSVQAAAQPQPPQAGGAVVMEATTERVLYARHPHARMGMASTTKVMTALVVLEHCALDEMVIVGPNASGVEGSSLYLEVGERLSVEQLLYALLLRSGNDCAVALAEHTAGSTEAFADLMNDRALALGAYDTHFVNPHGLSQSDHYTTAYDLALICAAAMRNDVFARIVATRSQGLPKDGVENFRRVVNKNKLLTLYDGANGIKTGYTKADGRCLAAAAQRDGMQLVCVLLDCPDMFGDAQRWMDACFEQYSLVNVLEAGQVCAQMDVRDGVRPAVDACAEQGLSLPLTQVEQGFVRLEVTLPAGMDAPLDREQHLGWCRAMLFGQELARVPLSAGQSVARRDLLWYIHAMIGGYLWNSPESGSKNIWPSAGWLPAVSASP